MFTPPPPDRCPGVLRPHLAADGALLRVRVPGGRTDHRALAALDRIAAEFGDEDLHLTSRGNLQIRGISPDTAGNVPPGLVNALAAAGFLPSFAHERVRNIVASPLSGIVGGRMDLRPVIAALDRALCADPHLADLPGRFLFGLDDGRADLAGTPVDLGAVALDGASARLRVGKLRGPVVARAEIAPVLAALARRFVELGEGRWHVRQLPENGRELLDAVEFPGFSGRGEQPDGTESTHPGNDPPHGVLPMAESRVALAGSVPLGVLTPALRETLVTSAARASAEIVLTPWRGVVVAPLPAGDAEDALAALTSAGLVVDPRSPWSRISACVGSPGCARSRGDTRAHATALAHRLAATGPRDGEPVHVVGCERACGAPRGPHTLTLLGSTT